MTILSMPDRSQTLQRGRHDGPHDGPHSGPHNGPRSDPHNGPRSGPHNGRHNGPHVLLVSVCSGLLAFFCLFMVAGCKTKRVQKKSLAGKKEKRQNREVGTEKGREGSARGKPKCLYRLHIHRRHSYLREVRSKPNTRLDDFQKKFKAIPVGKNCAPISHTKEFQHQGAPLFCFDPESKRAVVNSAVFSTLKSKHPGRVEGQFVVGKVKKEALRALSPAKVVKFLLRAQIILTYIHMHADLCATKQDESQGSYRIAFDAKHVYYTNQKNVGRYRFSVEITKEGQILIHGR
jgi:hypothetical protein